MLEETIVAHNQCQLLVIRIIMSLNFKKRILRWAFLQDYSWVGICLLICHMCSLSPGACLGSMKRLHLVQYAGPQPIVLKDVRLSTWDDASQPTIVVVRLFRSGGILGRTGLMGKV